MPPDEVKPAFLDVVSAREEREAKINEATRYENENIPIARGDAERLKNEAEGYKTRRINEAEGDVARYQAIQAEYAKDRSITRTRLYLEMIREVLPQLKSVTIVDDGDTLKFLPLGGSLQEVLR
jgi:membrane protease subunit HflK